LLINIVHLQFVVLDCECVSKCRNAAQKYTFFGNCRSFFKYFFQQLKKNATFAPQI